MESIRYVRQKEPPTKVVVHPVVLLSVVDHYNRVAKGTKRRVVGLLLGSFEKDGSIEVRNCFAVPFEEDEKDKNVWFLDHDYLDNMFEMFRKVNTSEHVVGWYHTGPKLRMNDMEINEIVQRYLTHPVMVIVDVKLKDDSTRGLPIRAYYCVEEIYDDGSQTSKSFKNLPGTLGAEEAEEVGVEHLLRDITDTSAGTLAKRISQTAHSLRGLKEKLEGIEAYLRKVVEGSMPMKHKISYHLQDIFNLIPNLDLEDITKSFAVTTNDQLSVVYLASLVRSVIALHSLISNKITNQKREREEIEFENRLDAQMESKENTKEDKGTGKK